MSFLYRMAMKIGLIKPKMPENIPHIAVYTLMILDHLLKTATDLADIKQAIENYPEDTHREGFVCKGMKEFVAVFKTFEHLKLAVEQQFDKNGGRSSTESQRDSMERLESWYDE